MLNTGVGKRAQWVKCLLSEKEDLSLIPGTQVKTLMGPQLSWRQVWACYPNLAQSVSSSYPDSASTDKEVIEKHIRINLWPPYAHMSTHTHTCTQKRKQGRKRGKKAGWLSNWLDWRESPLGNGMASVRMSGDVFFPIGFVLGNSALDLSAWCNFISIPFTLKIVPVWIKCWLAPCLCQLCVFDASMKGKTESTHPK